MSARYEYRVLTIRDGSTAKGVNEVAAEGFRFVGSALDGLIFERRRHPQRVSKKVETQRVRVRKGQFK